MKTRLLRMLATGVAAALLLLPSTATAAPAQKEGNGRALAGRHGWAFTAPMREMMFGRDRGHYGWRGYGSGMMGGRHRTGVHGEDHGFGGPWAVAMIVMMAALIGAIALAAFLLTRRHDGPQARPPSALSR